MEKHQRDVHHLHATGVFKPTPPARITLDDYPFELRCRLLLEETYEFVRACGLAVIHIREVSENGSSRRSTFDVEFERIDEPNLVNMIDAIVDVEVVNLGSAVSMGADVDPFWDEVQRANADKARGDLRADGKRQKPIGWTPPDIAGVLARVRNAEDKRAALKPKSELDRRAEDVAAREMGTMGGHDEWCPGGYCISVEPPKTNGWRQRCPHCAREILGQDFRKPYCLSPHPKVEAAPSPVATVAEVFVPDTSPLDFDTARLSPIEATPGAMADAGIISHDLAKMMETPASWTNAVIAEVRTGTRTNTSLDAQRCPNKATARRSRTWAVCADHKDHVTAYFSEAIPESWKTDGRCMANRDGVWTAPPVASTKVEIDPNAQRIDVEVTNRSAASIPDPEGDGGEVKFDVANPTMQVTYSFEQIVAMVSSVLSSVNVQTTEAIAERIGLPATSVESTLRYLFDRGQVSATRYLMSDRKRVSAWQLIEQAPPGTMLPATVRIKTSNALDLIEETCSRGAESAAGIAEETGINALACIAILTELRRLGRVTERNGRWSA